MTPARKRVLETVADGAGLGQAARIVGASGVSPSVIEGLERAGALERLEIPAPPIVLPPDPDCGGPPTLYDEQAAALARHPRASTRMHFGVALLDGVTGGGKTEVFFEAVADTLRAGRQALILLPEIALTHSFLERFTTPLRHAARRVAFGHDAGAAHPHLARHQ